MKKAFKKNRVKIAAINEKIEDNLSGIRVVKSFANEELENEKFQIGNQEFLEAKKDNRIAVIVAKLLRRIEANKYQTLKGFYCASFLYNDEFAILQEVNPDFLKSMRNMRNNKC